ncbi:MAG TPA: radical SAM protein [Roseiarcus sp.]|nr:radical SAM protein [Roseiarcus sp.]
MNVIELARIGADHVRNAVAEEIYLRTGRDVTVPISIYGEVIERCNYKCRYCDYWRRPNYRDEMSIDEWKKALLDLKDFIGRYHIEFSGGEPYIKRGLIDLLTFCGEQGLKWGVTTNGGAFGNEKIVDRTVAAHPFNINISIDSRDADIHDYSRGVDGSLNNIVAGIRALNRAKANYGADFPIIIKAVVHKLNFRKLPDMVDWVRAIGATAINFQPIEQVTEEARGEFWIGREDIDDLIKVRDRLLEIKRAGGPILNSELLLNLWPNHFRREKAPREAMPCRIGMRNFFIRSDGRVEMCWNFPPIGNVRTQTAREIWYGEQGSQRRKETVACETLCLFTCLSQKNIGDKFKMGMKLLARPDGAERL